MGEGGAGAEQRWAGRGGAGWGRGGRAGCGEEAVAGTLGVRVPGVARSVAGARAPGRGRLGR